jgi:multidrug efflux pump subunit AcrB
VNRAIAWFAENHVAANLIMMLLIAGGITSSFFVKMEVFPEVRPEIVWVTVEYPGAAPEEVEEAICIKIEEEIEGLESVDRITSSAAEGIGVVMVELFRGENVREALDDIKSRVDAIDTFPEEAEKPVIRDLVYRQPVISVAISGDADERSLKVLGERVRDELTALPAITQVELANARPYEISIEVSESALRRHGLTFDRVAAAVRRSSVDVPGGSIKSEGGEILLRAKGQAYRGAEFERLVLLTREDGTRVTLGEIARVVDGFEETDQSARFDGRPTVVVQVWRVGDQSALEIARTVKEYVARAQASMPEGIVLTTWADDSKPLRDRLSTLLRNGIQGAALVFAVLTLFLRLRLAFWVILGVPLSFLGALWLMPSLDVSINVISLFAFILVLGILVDDAIVVGENIYTHQQKGSDRLQAAIAGAQAVATPVVFGVLTTVAAFMPLLILPGPMGQVFGVMGLTAILCLGFSIVESLFVLPAHLGHSRARGRHGAGGSNPVSRAWYRFQERFARMLEAVVEQGYRPALRVALRWRYLTVSAGVSVLLVALAVPISGKLRFSFFPPIEADNVIALLTMPLGTPPQVTRAHVERIAAAAEELRAQVDAEKRTVSGSIVRHVLASIGEQPSAERGRAGPPSGATTPARGGHLAEVNLELAPGEERSIGGEEMETRWRGLVGQIPDAVELAFTSSYFEIGEPINIQLQGTRVESLRVATDRLKERLAEYPGVFDVADSFRGGKRELELDIRPSAEALGLTLADLGRQVRQAFYGEEAQRIQRERDDVKVMVRFPAIERRSLGDLEDMRVRTPDGREVPFAAVAIADLGRGFATIQRSDRQRVINVTADLDLTRANANEILADLRSSVLPRLLAEHPGISYSMEGEQREQTETLSGLLRGFTLALFIIYALLAVPLRSYFQPLLIMSVIPFGFIGAIAGHLIMGHNLSVMSMVGIVALSGVVVNSSLVMVHWVNGRRAQGVSLDSAVRDAGAARFRPIVLTSLTTFVGLTPLMLEKSMQAQFLVPMAVSLAYGVLFATVITLFVIPSGYLILEDLKAVFGGSSEARPTLVPAQPPERDGAQSAPAAGR